MYAKRTKGEGVFLEHTKACNSGREGGGEGVKNC